MAETLLDFDGGWLKVLGSESQYVQVSDGKRQNLTRLPDLDETNRGVWIVTDSATQAVRAAPTDFSYKLGARKKGELLYAEGSLTVGGVWLKLAPGQYILTSNDSGSLLERLPPLDQSQAGKWVVACLPSSLSHFSLLSRSDNAVRCGPSSGCTQTAAKRLGQILEAEGVLHFDGGWLKLAAPLEAYMRIADGGAAPLLSPLPELDRSDSGAWVICAAAAQHACDGLDPDAGRPTDCALRRGEIVRAEGSLRFRGATWLALAARPPQYVAATDAAGAALLARLPALDPSAAGTWVVAAAPAPVWLGLGGESRRVGVRRPGEAVRAEGGWTVQGETWVKLLGAERYVLLSDGAGQRLARPAAPGQSAEQAPA
jgi:hypothetical protein